MTTAGELIEGSLRLIGQLAEGEQPSNGAYKDGLAALNMMLDSWSTESLSVFTTQEQAFTWPSGEATQSLGPSGDFIGHRPVQLAESTYYKDPTTGISYGIKIINQSQYDSIALKTVSAPYPQVLWINTNMPNIDMYLYPVPSRNLDWLFVSYEELSQPAEVTTTLSFPPGYLRAFKYNLACEMATEFGVEPPTQVLKLATASKRDIRRVNQNDDILAVPSFLTSGRPRFNIYTGNYS